MPASPGSFLRRLTLHLTCLLMNLGRDCLLFLVNVGMSLAHFWTCCGSSCSRLRAATRTGWGEV